MLRRLIIATGTLGVILIGFGLYRSRNAPPEKTLPPLPEVTLASASAPASQQTVPGLKNLRIAPGKEATFEFFDPKGQLQYMMKTAEWKAENQNELSLNKPELWKFMRNGQTLRITADTGQITVEPAGKSNLKPKRGWLRNNVKISIDMTTRQWRQMHPGQETIEQHPQHVISIAMDSLYFDDDLSLIRTEESVQVHAARFDIASTGLKLIYSRPLDRLEHLVLLNKGTLTLRGDLDLNEPSGNGQTSSAARPATARARARATTSPAEAPATASAPASTLASQPAKYQDIYRAVLEGPIHFQQYRENRLVATLDADKLLELVFDMTQQERQGSSDDQTEKPMSALGAAEPQGQDSDNRTELTWAGTLEINPIERNPITQAKRTARIRAVGEKVVLVDKEEGNTITCQELDYDAAARSGRLTAEAPAMARLLDARGGYLAGQDIRFSQADQVLEINGPGQAEEAAASSATQRAGVGSDDSGPSKLRWTHHLMVRFQPVSMPLPLSVIPLTMPDKPSAMARLNQQTIFEMRRPSRHMEPLAGNPFKGLAADSAVIAGDAMIERGNETIRADKLAIGFFPPEPRGKTFGPIQSAVGEGQVRLAARQQDISADSLDVRFVPAGTGRSTPIRAIAQGHAVASQGKSRIAADFLDATLAQVPVEASGNETEALPANEKMKPAVVALTASSHVQITDPDQDMDMVGDALTATMPDGRQVKNVDVKGSVGAPARITMKDYALSGPSIQADMQTQDLVLPSAGSVKLLVRQGPEGTRLDKARPLLITWTDRMRMWGTRNQALFEGHVQAVLASTEESGDDTAVTSDRMTVYFRAVGAGEPQQQAEPSPAFKIMQKARQQILEVMPDAAEWLPATPARHGNKPSFSSAAQREPVKILAEGNAKAVSSRYDASRKFLTSRLLVEGATFIADLGREHLEVPGKGKLLIEDYSIAKAAARFAAAGGNPATLPAAVKSVNEDNLSQTVFAWSSGMTFSLAEQLAVFDSDVNMVHRSGSKVVLGSQLAEALGAKPSLLQVMPGRLATLNCDNLVVQFSEAQNQSKQEAAAADQWLKRAQLENMIATGNVYLNEELSNGGSSFLTAGRVQYSGERDTFVIQGAPGSLAKLIRQKDAQSPPEPVSMKAFWWNRRTGEVSAQGIRGQGAS
jgi:hypothetical protein